MLRDYVPIPAHDGDWGPSYSPNRSLKRSQKKHLGLPSIKGSIDKADSPLEPSTRQSSAYWSCLPFFLPFDFAWQRAMSMEMRGQVLMCICMKGWAEDDSQQRKNSWQDAPLWIASQLAQAKAQMSFHCQPSCILSWPWIIVDPKSNTIGAAGFKIACEGKDYNVATTL